MRTALTLLASAALSVVVGSALPPPPTFQVNTGVHPERFWTTKARWTASFDVALGGDSRVFRGLSPAAMASELPGLRIANYGFSSVGFSSSYLQALRATLDPKSTKPTIVLGVTPHSLTAQAREANGFLAERARSPREVAMRLTFSPLADFFRPVRFDEWLAPRPPTVYRQHHHPDGWVASRLEPPSPDGALREYRRNLEPLDADVVRSLVEHVRAWRAEGVEVVACRPPASPALRELEEQMTGYREPAIAACLRAAGARWVRLAERATYDGSHLDEHEAIAWSRELALRIARHDDDDLGGACPEAFWRGTPAAAP